MTAPQRIPLDVVVTATGARTPDVLVAVMASDLDALEAEVERLTPRASRHLDILDHFCRVSPDLVQERMRKHRPISWDGFTPLDCEACGQPWPCSTEQARTDRTPE